MDLPVVHPAQHHQVVDLCVAAVFPRDDVVDFAPARWAAAPRATPVAGRDRPAHSVRDDSGCSADVEWLPFAAHHDRDDCGVASEHPHITGGEVAGEVQGGGGPGALLQLRQRDVHGEAGPVSAGCGDVAVVEDEPADVGQGVGLALLRAALVITGGRLGFRVDQGGDLVEQDRVVEPALDHTAGRSGWRVMVTSFTSASSSLSGSGPS
ncbi:hypothetical protein WEH80_36405 [Actinomycetes bacterium KLBMP 9759]